MKFGLHLGTRGLAADPDALVAVAQHAEALGFSHLGLSDHLVIATEVDSTYPYRSSGTWFAQDTGVCLEQVTALGFVAAATKRIRLLSSVMVLPHRPALLAAKMLTTVDVLSKGRLTVGAGVGWTREELALLGAPPFAERGRASDEFIEAFRKLWTDPRPAYAGRYVAFENILFEPKPVQRPHPPIWVGGEGAAARRRAGRLGDGWYPVVSNPKAPLDTPEAFAAGFAEVRRAAEQAGRDPTAIGTALYAIWYRRGASDASRDGRRLPFTGSVNAIVEDIEAYRARGLGELLIGLESNDLQESLDGISAFASDVMSRFRT